MADAKDSGERAATRGGSALTLRTVLDVAIIIIGFFLSTTVMNTNSMLREHDQQIQILKTQSEERKQSNEREVLEVKTSLSQTNTWLSKLSDKVDRIAEKVGAK